MSRASFPFLATPQPVSQGVAASQATGQKGLAAAWVAQMAVGNAIASKRQRVAAGTGEGSSRRRPGITTTRYPREPGRCR